MVRLAILCAVVFAVVYGITRALRDNAHSKEAKRIQREIQALRAGIEQGMFDQREYEQLAERIKEACEREGIDVPELPEKLKNERAGKRGEES